MSDVEDWGGGSLIYLREAVKQEMLACMDALIDWDEEGAKDHFSRWLEYRAKYRKVSEGKADGSG